MSSLPVGEALEAPDPATGPPSAPERPRPGLSLRKIPHLAPRVTLKMTQVFRSKGLLRPDGQLRADDILVARTLANLPGRSPSANLDADVARILRRAVLGQELAPSTLLVVAGVDNYHARLAVNLDDPGIAESLQGLSAVSILPVGLWWHSLKTQGFAASAFDIPPPGEASMTG